MIRKIKYTILALLGFITLRAQVNLIPNPGFEEYYLCQNSLFITGQLDNNLNYNCLSYWFEVKGSPDLFTYTNSDIIHNGCLDGGSWRIPNTFFGFQYPRTDSCFMGLASWVSFYEAPFEGHNYYAREWAGIRLADTLKPNKCYEFTMYVSRAEKNGYNVSCLGAYFAKDSLYTEFTNDSILSPFPLELDSIQVLQDASVPIWDTVNWVPITGIFKANGGEAFLYIGNLLKDEYYTPIAIYPNANDSIHCEISYFFIDDVSLYEIEQPCGVGIDEKKVDKVRIYPNPAEDFVSIDLPKNINQAQLSIYNLTGQSISQKQVTQPNQQIPITELYNGMYIFVIQNEDKVIARQRVVVAR